MATVHGTKNAWPRGDWVTVPKPWFQNGQKNFLVKVESVATKVGIPKNVTNPNIEKFNSYCANLRSTITKFTLSSLILPNLLSSFHFHLGCLISAQPPLNPWDSAFQKPQQCTCPNQPVDQSALGGSASVGSGSSTTSRSDFRYDPRLQAESLEDAIANFPDLAALKFGIVWQNFDKNFYFTDFGPLLKIFFLKDADDVATGD